MSKVINTTVGDLTPTVTYSGSITVKYKDKLGKERVICHHNSGETGLFSMACRALAGLPINKYTPKTIMAYTGTGQVKNAALVQTVGYTLEPVTYGEVNGSWQTDTISPSKIRYSFIIPGSVVKNPNVPLTEFKLFNDLNIACAKVTLSADEYVEPETGANILLYWDMSFTSTQDLGLPNLICRALIGFPIGAYLPKLMMAYAGTDATKHKALLDQIPYTATPVTYGKVLVGEVETWAIDTVNPVKIRYSFIIPHQILIDPGSDPLEISEFRIFNDLLAVCARVVLEDAIVPDDNSNLMIYWDIAFANESY